MGLEKNAKPFTREKLSIRQHAGPFPGETLRPAPLPAGNGGLPLLMRKALCNGKADMATPQKRLFLHAKSPDLTAGALMLATCGRR